MTRVHGVASPSTGRRGFGVVAVIVCYLDDSGTDSEAPVIVMAGYASPMHGWKKFERATKPIFREHGIGEFHAMEFHASKEQFKGWGAAKQLRFLTEWNAAASGNIMSGVTVGIPKATFLQRKAENPKVDPGISSYAQCFRGVLEHLIHDKEIWPLCIEHGVSFILENGNHNNVNVEQVFHRLKQHEPLGQVLRSIAFCDKADCYAIQYADYLAFYSRRHAVQWLDDPKKKMHPHMYMAKEAVRVNGQLAQDFDLTVSGKNRAEWKKQKHS